MRTNNTSRQILATVLAAILVLSTAALAQDGGSGKRGDGGGGRGKQKGEMIAKLAEKLDLTADQKARIKTLTDQFQQQHQTQRQELQNLHKQAQDARQAGNKDQAKSIHEQMKTKSEALKADRQKLMEQIKAILTPEQRTKLEQMKEQHKEKMENGKGKGKRGEMKEKRKSGSATPGQNQIN